MLNARPSLFLGDGEQLGGAPVFVERAEGPFLWDADGNRFIDFVLGWGSVVLGHADPEIDDVAIAAIRRGINPTLVSPMQFELTNLLSQEVPNAEASALFKTGSDATDAAVRLARAVTNRKSVVHWGLHGWHDWSATTAAGVLAETKKFTHALNFNNLESAKGIIKTVASDLACIVVMPFDAQLPDPEYLRALRNLAHDCGALFIIDEIRTGFRVHRHGAQRLFNVDADLVAVGKAMANGYPLSALCGRRELMENIIRLGITVTFYRSPVSIAASIKTVQKLAEMKGADRLAELGNRLKRNVAELGSDLVDVFEMRGHPSMPDPYFKGPFLKDWRRYRDMLCTRLYRRGVLTPAFHHWFICTSMTNSEIDQVSEMVVEIARDILKVDHR